MHVVRSFCSLTLIGGEFQPVFDVDSLDDKDASVLLDLANRV